jgi:DNA-binding NtrC family response regulator
MGEVGKPLPETTRLKISRSNRAAWERRRALQPWEQRKLEARALEKAAAIHSAERRSILPEASETLDQAVLRYEGLLIAAALAYTKGKLVEASNLLNMSYQALAYSINHRHQELLTLRSPVRRRSKKTKGE